MRRRDLHGSRRHCQLPLLNGFGARNSERSLPFVLTPPAAPLTLAPFTKELMKQQSIASLALRFCVVLASSQVRAAYPTFGTIERHDARFDALVGADARLEKLADGFNWSEGPVWVRNGGYLLFSDVPQNTV